MTLSEAMNILRLTPEEEHLIDTLDLDFGKLKWRRDTIKTKCQNDVNIFNQEYPYDDTVCFLTSGRPVFDRQKLEIRKNELIKQYKENPPKVGYVEFNKVTGRYEFFPDRFGTVIIYEMPEKNIPYVIGGDIAEGLLHGDYSVSQVIDNITGKQVAKQRLHIHPDLFAEEQIKLARFYNEALIADEVNNHGLTTITSLQKLGYWKQYKREVIDKISKTKMQKFGFDTKGGANGSRRKAINNLRAIIRDTPELISDLETIEEMLTFIYNSEGKEIGESDTHDDTVLSLAIAHDAREQESKTGKRQVQSGKKTDAQVKSGFIEERDYKVHPSVFADTHKNEKLREAYRKMYESEVERRHKLKK